MFSFSHLIFLPSAKKLPLIIGLPFAIYCKSKGSSKRHLPNSIEFIKGDSFTGTATAADTTVRVLGTLLCSQQ